MDMDRFGRNMESYRALASGSMSAAEKMTMVWALAGEEADYRRVWKTGQERRSAAERRVKRAGPRSDASFVARLNVEHFNQQLMTESDSGRRATLVRLLGEEEEKLLALG